MDDVDDVWLMNITVQIGTVDGREYMPLAELKLFGDRSSCLLDGRDS